MSRIIFIPIVNIISLLLLFTAISGCSNSNQLQLSGRIDEEMFNKFEKLNKPGKQIVLSSGGGETILSYKIARNIELNENIVVIKGECLSACAEDILAAAKGVIFKSEPLIGFHWNSYMNRAQMIRYGGDVSLCTSKGIDNQKYLYDLKKLNLDFWKEIERRLVLERFQVVPKTNACPWKHREFKNRMWLPTSDQLKNLWGLQFDGSVCADNIEYCQKKIDGRWKAGSRIVVGDEVYVSKGQSSK